MSAFKSVTLECDGCGERKTITSYQDDIESARSCLTKLGTWFSDGTRDYCQECQKRICTVYIVSQECY